jgi:Zn finger protein HypA/HybF involved in hydrogenase expression
MTHDDAHLTDLLIYRCGRCGDIFPLDRDQVQECPSCHGKDVTLASEPLL